jgi:hypothetical protein
VGHHSRDDASGDQERRRLDTARDERPAEHLPRGLRPELAVPQVGQSNVRATSRPTKSLCADPNAET